MARLPGLRPSEDRPSVSGANRGRVQVRNPIGDKGLQPQARPVDQYVRPQQPNQGPSGLAQLAGALAQISPGIQGFIDQEATQQKTAAEDLANRRIGGMSFADAKAAVDSGSMSEMQNPWFKAAFMKQYGERLAYQRMNELGQAYATSPDKGSMNMDQFVAQQMAQDIDQYGADKHFVSTYGQLMSGFNQRAGAAQTEFATSEIIGDAKQGVYETFLGRANAMIEQGDVPPDQIAAALRGAYDGNKNMLGISFKEQDAELLRVAQALAEQGHYDVVKALLADNRTGSDGTVLGPLMGNREFSVDAANILTTAETKAAELGREASFNSILSWEDQARQGVLSRDALLDWHRANPNIMSETEVMNLIHQSDGVRERAVAEQAATGEKIALENQEIIARGELRRQNMQMAQQGRVPFLKSTQLPDASGKMVDVTPDKQREWLVEDIANTAQHLVETGELDEAGALDYQIATLATSGLVSDQWTDVLTGGFTGANYWNLSSDTRPPGLEEGAKLYMEMYAKAPALLEKHLEDASVKRFYETYRIAVQRLRMKPDQAYAHAANVTRQPPIDNPMTTIRKEDLERVVRDIGSNGGGWFNGTANNEAWVAEEVQRRAADYSLAGTLTGTAALAEAKKDFLNTHTPINGQWINTADAVVPQEFEELAKVTLEDFATAHDIEPEDLTMQPSSNGTGAWEIIYKGAVPMLAGPAAESNVTLEDMYDARIAKQQARIEELKAQQAAGNDAAMSGLQAELEQINSDLGRHDTLARMGANYRPVMLQPREELEKRRAEIMAIMGQ